MAYDAGFWRQHGNWPALTGALTGAATRKDYLAMVRHIEAAQTAGMTDQQIRRAYAEVMKMLPGLPTLETLGQAAGVAPLAISGAPTGDTAPTVSAAPIASAAPTTSAAPAPAPTVATSTATSTTPTAAPVEDAARPVLDSAPPATTPGPTPHGPASLSAPTPTDVPEAPSELTDPTGRPVVQQLDHWLTVLRTGDDAQKIEARENLSLIFEQRSLFAEAIEMLEGNVWAGVRDANMQRRLAALYRQIGRQDLADKAISDLYQLGMSGAASTTTTYAGISAVASPYRTDAAAAPAPVDVATTAATEPAPVVPAPPWRRPRPVWLTIALTVATFGLYGYYWLFASWRELKRETDDRTMHPFWHAFGIAIIPIYGWIQFYAHMRTIRRHAIMAGTGTTLSPGFCAWLFIITAVVNRLTIRIEPWTPTPPWLDLMVLTVDVVLVAWPQAVLTNTWQRLPGGAAPFKVHGFEWFLLFVGGLIWAAILAGVAPP